MPPKASITILSSEDHSVLELFPNFLSATATAPVTIQVVTELARKVVRAFLDAEHPPITTQVTLIPVLRAGLPMYVAASPLLPNSDTALVQCFNDKSAQGPSSVRVNWMGTSPIEAKRRDTTSMERHLVILDTILATGDTVLRLCDELSDLEAQVTVLCCYASPQALAAIAGHEVVHSIFVAHQADTVDENGYLVPYTNGDVGDKLFGKKITP